MSQIDSHSWASTLRLPLDWEGDPLILQPKEPKTCTRRGQPTREALPDATFLHWELRCSKLDGEILSVTGFNGQLGDAVVELRPLQGNPVFAVLSSSRPAWKVAFIPQPPGVAQYFPLGVQHILGGPDHLLFVAGLWALWRRRQRTVGNLVKTLSAFTLAHSVTLAGATLWHWWLPSSAVEACIAASILLLAVELARDPLSHKPADPLPLAAGFGLLHGFGFAGALKSTGLPEHAQAWALAAFNLGVEAGQLIFVVILFALVRFRIAQPRLAPLALTAYGAVAGCWMLERSLDVLTS